MASSILNSGFASAAILTLRRFKLNRVIVLRHQGLIPTWSFMRARTVWDMIDKETPGKPGGLILGLRIGINWNHGTFVGAEFGPRRRWLAESNHTFHLPCYWCYPTINKKI